MQKPNIRSGLIRKERHERFAIKDWTNRLINIPAFIIGCAPSAAEVDYSLLENYFTIGINRAYKLLDPTILMWQDITFWHTEQNNIKRTKAIKIARDIADPKKLYYNFYLKNSEYEFSKQTHVLKGRGSSGPLAVEFAVALGCSPIILIGMDCQTESHKTDFFGTNQFWTEHTLTNCFKGLQFIHKYCPVPIKNCGNSELWIKESLESVLTQIDPKSVYKQSREYYNKMLTGKMH